jgi:serine/threonine-protein kinase
VYLEPPRLNNLREDVPAELDRLVAELLAKDPERRPSATEAAEVLGALAAVATEDAARSDRRRVPAAAVEAAPTVAPDAVAGPTAEPGPPPTQAQAHVEPGPPGTDDPRQDDSSPRQ